MHPSAKFAAVRVAASCGAALSFLVSCSSDLEGPRSGPEVLVVQPANVTLMAGQSLLLNVVTTGDQPGLRASEVVWSSSDTRVAAVSKDGAVKGGVPGTARIEAWWKGTRGNASVTVLDAGRRHTTALAARVASEVASEVSLRKR